MMSYKEYKRMQNLIAVANREAIKKFEEDGTQLTPEDCFNMMTQISEICNFSDEQLLEIVEVAGFAGFEKMIAEYPSDFRDDLEFWVDAFELGYSMSAVVKLPDDIMQLLLESDDYKKGVDFINNPWDYIK